MILGVGAGAEAGLDAETDVDAEADAEGDRGAEEEVRRLTIGNITLLELSLEYRTNGNIRTLLLQVQTGQ